jgi:6-phosphogluconolactonase
LANSEIRVVSDPAALAQAATDVFVNLCDAAIKESGRFTVALSGGSTPKAMFNRLSDDTLRDLIRWDAVHLFWGDERHVPPDHAESNYRMTREALLSKVPIPDSNVHRIKAENPDPDAAAMEYAAELRAFFELVDDQLPQFDLVMLGMGPDGHCASLFPGTHAVRERTSLVAVPWVDKFSTYRITLTPPVINNGKQVMFLVGGADKAETLRHVLEGKRETDRFPSQVIQPTSGRLLWLVDEAAARLLQQKQ